MNKSGKSLSAVYWEGLHLCTGLKPLYEPRRKYWPTAQPKGNCVEATRTPGVGVSRHNILLYGKEFNLAQREVQPLASRRSSPPAFVHLEALGYSKYLTTWFLWSFGLHGISLTSRRTGDWSQPYEHLTMSTYWLLTPRLRGPLLVSRTPWILYTSLPRGVNTVRDSTGKRKLKGPNLESSLILPCVSLPCLIGTWTFSL